MWKEDQEILLSKTSELEMMRKNDSFIGTQKHTGYDQREVWKYTQATYYKFPLGREARLDLKNQL